MNEDQKVPVLEGRADRRGLRVRIVAAKYNRAVVDALVEGEFAAALSRSRRFWLVGRGIRP